MKILLIIISCIALHGCSALDPVPAVTIEKTDTGVKVYQKSPGKVAYSSPDGMKIEVDTKKEPSFLRTLSESILVQTLNTTKGVSL